METTQHATEKKKRVTNKSKSKSENISKQMKWEANFPIYVIQKKSQNNLTYHLKELEKEQSQKLAEERK